MSTSIVVRRLGVCERHPRETELVEKFL